MLYRIIDILAEFFINRFNREKNSTMIPTAVSWDLNFSWKTIIAHRCKSAGIIDEPWADTLSDTPANSIFALLSEPLFQSRESDV